MSWASFLYDRYIQIDLCHWEIGSMFYYIATTHLGHIYDHAFPVNPMWVLWAEYMNVSLTFAWNFVDFFIIILSIGIASNFAKINARLEFFRGRVRWGSGSPCRDINYFPKHFRLSPTSFGRRFAVITIRCASFTRAWTRKLATLCAWRVSLTCTLCACSC